MSDLLYKPLYVSDHRPVLLNVVDIPICKAIFTSLFFLQQFDVHFAYNSITVKAFAAEPLPE